MSATITLELAEKMLIKFDGTKSKLHEFLDNCDKANQLIKPELKDILFAIIETKLTDNARAMVRNRSFEDWKGLKQHLLDIYSDKRTNGQWQLELNSCRQNFGESVASYSNKVENSYVKLLNTLDSDLSKEARSACINLLKTQALNVFITGLNKDLSLIVKANKPDSLETAIAVALSEEQELKSKIEINKYQNVNNSYAKMCNFCNKPGHATFNCRYNQNRYEKRSQVNIKQFQSNHSYSQRNNSHFQNNSQLPNHKNQKFCNYCKKNGHIINECRKREYNNNKNKNRNNQQENSANSAERNLNYERSQPTPTGSRQANVVQSEYQQTKN